MLIVQLVTLKQDDHPTSFSCENGVCLGTSNHNPDRRVINRGPLVRRLKSTLDSTRHFDYRSVVQRTHYGPVHRLNDDHRLPHAPYSMRTSRRQPYSLCVCRSWSPRTRWFLSPYQWPKPVRVAAAALGRVVSLRNTHGPDDILRVLLWCLDPVVNGGCVGRDRVILHLFSGTKGENTIFFGILGHHLPERRLRTPLCAAWYSIR